MKNTIFKSLLICAAAQCGALTIDPNFSPYAGADNFLFLQKRMEKIEDGVFSQPACLVAMDDQKPLAVNERWARWIRDVVFWFPVSYSMSVAQHEVFGHGYRIRDLGSKYAKVTNYKIGIFSGATTYEPTDHLSPSQMLTIAIAGLEADSLLAGRIRLNGSKKESSTPGKLLYISPHPIPYLLIP